METALLQVTGTLHKPVPAGVSWQQTDMVIYIYIYTFTHIHTCTNIRTHAHTHTHWHRHAYTHAQAHTHTYTHTHTSKANLSIFVCSDIPFAQSASIIGIRVGCVPYTFLNEKKHTHVQYIIIMTPGNIAILAEKNWLNRSSTSIKYTT